MKPPGGLTNELHELLANIPHIIQSGDTITAKNYLDVYSDDLWWSGMDVGWTLTHYTVCKAVTRNQPAILLVLLDVYGDEVWPGENSNLTLVYYAIFEAARGGNNAILNDLLGRHGDELSPCRTPGRTLRMYAVANAIGRNKESNTAKVLLASQFAAVTKLHQPHGRAEGFFALPFSQSLAVGKAIEIYRRPRCGQ